MTKIKLDAAHVEGYEGAFYRFTTDQGLPSAHGIFGNWYEAVGTDADGNEYRIVWHIADVAAFESGDENCCDWGNPDEILCLDTGYPVQNADVELYF